jgi:hypothetical protein
VFYSYEQDLCGYYPVFSGWSRLDSTVIKDYQQYANPVVTKRNNIYDSNHNLSISSMKDSDNEEIYEKFFYPYSVETYTLPYMHDLRVLNRISHPIYRTKFIDWSTSYKYIYRIKEHYDLFGSNVLLKKHELIYDNQPYSPSPINMLEKHDIQNYGNVIEVNKEDDLKTSFIWGYNHSYQIIKGENVESDILQTAVQDAVSAVGKRNLEELLSDIRYLKTTEQKDLWCLFNSELRRNPLLQNSLVTTYSFLPLIGITSLGDPSGIITYYEYDIFGRLAFIRDHNNDIVKQYEYHFPGQ